MIELDPNYFKQHFINEAEKYLFLLNQKFILDDFNSSFYNKLCLYFSNSPDFENKIKGNLNKGLLVYGDIGTGKSSSFEIIHNIVRKNKLEHLRFSINSTTEIVTEYNSSNSKEEVILKHSKGNSYFDDLGAESIASNFGKEDIFIKIFDFRYNEFRKKRAKTFVTTNYSLEELEDRYGRRIADRFKEMFNFLPLLGESRRQ